MSLPSSSAVCRRFPPLGELECDASSHLLELRPAVTGGRCLRTSWLPHSLPRVAAEVERRSRSGGREANSRSSGASAAHPDTVQTRGSPQLQVAASCPRVSLCTACLSASSPERPLMATPRWDRRTRPPRDTPLLWDSTRRTCRLGRSATGAGLKHPVADSLPIEENQKPRPEHWKPRAV